MRSALGLLPQGLQVRVQRLPAALLLARRVRLGQQDLRPLLWDGVDARAGLGLLDVLLIFRRRAGGGRREARRGGRGAAVLGGDRFRELGEREEEFSHGGLNCEKRVESREAGYQDLAWTSPRPLSFLLEEKLTFLLSGKTKTVNATAGVSEKEKCLSLKG